MRGTLAITTVFGLTALAGCGSDPANIAGDYTVSVANEENGCNVDTWDENGTATNIGVSIDQNGESASATVTGATGNFLDFVLGEHVFVGTVDRSSFELKMTGTRGFESGNCNWTYDAVLDGTIDGDAIEGEIRYEAQTDMASDCTGITGCTNVQSFTGTRPSQ